MHPNNTKEEEKPHFGKCVSDPKLIVARHVFGDSDDFCKKTLDVSEQIAMILNRKCLTLLYKVFKSWRQVINHAQAIANNSSSSDNDIKEVNDQDAQYNPR